MPQEDEFANQLGQSSMVNRTTRRKLSELELTNADSVDSDDLRIKSDFQLKSPSDSVIVIDGSPVEIPIGNTLEATAGAIQVSIVEIDTRSMRKQGQKRFVDPVEIENAKKSEVITLTLPGKNTSISIDEMNMRESWSKYMFEGLVNNEVNGRSLYKSYIDLCSRTSRVTDKYVKFNGCPSCGSETFTHTPIDVDENPEKCISCGEKIYPTDRLRIHERVSEGQSVSQALNVLMSVVENLSLSSFLLDYKKDDSPTKDSTIIMDGPLSQFDTAAWISEPFQELINEIRDYQGFVNVVGINKSGKFAAFAKDVFEGDEIPDENRLVLEMSSDFIYDYVVNSREQDALYGEDPKNYFGKNFMYRSSDNNVFSITVPRLIDDSEDSKSLEYEYDKYPELPKILATIEDNETQLFSDGIIPLHFAHKEASIPKDMGTKILSELATQEVANSKKLYEDLEKIIDD